MDILSFINDKQAVSQWLEAQGRQINADLPYCSYWQHSRGFGIVVVLDGRSMELHLLDDGGVTVHLEEFNPATTEFDTLVSEQRHATSFDEFEHMYNALRDQVLAPNNSFKPKPLRGSA